MFAVEVTDELPRALTTFERRLLRETLLETAHELSGIGLRPARRRASPSAASSPRRDARCARAGCCTACAAPRSSASSAACDSVPALRKGLRDREPLVRFACAHALTRVGAQGLLDEVLGALAEGETVFSQGALAEVLLDSGPDSVNELRTLLGDPRHPRRRRLIVVVLGELRAFEAVPELIAALDDADDELCARACHALGKIGDPESAEAARGRGDGRRAPLVRAHRRGRRLRADRRPARRRHAGRRARQRGVVPAQRGGDGAGPARGRRRGGRLQPRRLARARVGRALLGPARRRRATPRRRSSGRRAASAGCAASSPPRRAPGRPPASRSSPRRETATGRYATMVLGATPLPRTRRAGGGARHDGPRPA